MIGSHWSIAAPHSPRCTDLNSQRSNAQSRTARLNRSIHHGVGNQRGWQNGSVTHRLQEVTREL